MRRGRTNAVIFRLCGGVYILAGIVTVIVAAVLEVDITWWGERWPHGLSFIEGIRNLAPLALFVSIGSTDVARMVREYIGCTSSAKMGHIVPFGMGLLLPARPALQPASCLL